MPFEPGQIPEGAKPFRPGQTGNPNGRPKGKSISTLLSELLEKKVKDVDGEERTRAEIIALKLLGKATNAKTVDNSVLKAIEQILDRSEGKAKQTVNLTNNVRLIDEDIIFE